VPAICRYIFGGCCILVIVRLSYSVHHTQYTVSPLASMRSILGNITANLFGRFWILLMSVAFVPLYIRLLGVEAYGLIGFFLSLQGVLGILDLGLSVTLSRELARVSATENVDSRAPRLLRTIEAAYWAVSATAGLVVIVLAPWIANHWINGSAALSGQVPNIVRLMGLAIALQMPLSLYQGGLSGIQRQVSLNMVLIVAATVRSVGTAFVLWWLVPSVQAYFYCQLLVGVMAAAALRTMLWRYIQGNAARSRIDLAVLRGVWKFAALMSGSAIFNIVLAQLDKLVLVKLLSLEQFGYYSIAASAASVLWSLILPISMAAYPKFVQLHDRAADHELSALYHQACQLVAVILLPTTLLFVMFSKELLLLWTANELVSQNSHRILALLAVGTAINGLCSVAGYLQSAAGWPGLMFVTNASLSLILVPMLLVAAPRSGAVGAAAAWVVINCAYLFISVPVMHKRLLKGELLRWYRIDILLPLLAVAGVGVIARTLAPTASRAIVQLSFFGIVWCAAAIAVVMVLPNIRYAILAPIRTQIDKYLPSAEHRGGK
jgi:O-antigen/teichoic acid export membrane protein